MKHNEIMEKHNYYEKNKEALLASVESIGQAATCKKWNIPSGSLSLLVRRWTKEGANPDEKKKSAKSPQHATDPPLSLPAWRDEWDAEVQIKWLEVYGKLIESRR